MTEAAQGLIPELQVLSRLAPSRFNAFVACPLREVFRASNAPKLLASVGAAHLGTVIHQLLEHAAKSDVLQLAQVEVLFGNLVREQEEKMAGSATARTAIPLARSVRDFEVRKRRAIHAAILSAGRRPTRDVSTSPNALRVGSEVWVQSTDGSIGGYIDEVAIVEGAVIVRDFKSGVASRRSSEQFAGAMQQVQLYAALYAETTGTWPGMLEIVPVDGEAVSAPVDRDECEVLLRQAKTLLAECNAIIDAGTGATHQLARPAPETCRRCEYRPICEAYAAARTQEEQWPRDVIGEVLRRENLRNGTVFFAVTTRDGVVTVRGLTNDMARYEALSRLVIGSKAGFYNLRGGREGGSYTETSLTTVVAFS